MIAQITVPVQTTAPIAARECSPFMMGVLDAQEGYPFAPEMYFAWWGDLLEYTAGFEEVRGECLITAAFKAQWPAAVEDDAIEDDYEWIREGGA